MIRFSVLLLLVFFLGGCASTGSEQADATADATESDGPVVEATTAAMKADKEEVICRREQQTGSRFSTRVCRTRAEIDARAAKDQKTMQESATRGGGSSGAINPSAC